MYRVPGVRDDEAPKRGTVDRLEVGRIGRLRAPIVAVTAVAALALANVPPSGRVAIALVALAVLAVLGGVRLVVRPSIVTVDRGAKIIACNGVRVAFGEVASVVVGTSSRELVLHRKEPGSPVLLVSGDPGDVHAAIDAILHAIIEDYETIRDMPPALAAAARSLHWGRDQKEREELVRKVLGGLPLEGLDLSGDAVLTTARGQSQGVSVVVRYTRKDDRVDVIVPRAAVGAGDARNIELLRGRYLSADRSGLVPVAPQIFVNGATNAAAFARLGSGPRILAEMERLNLRHIYLYPKEVKVIPYDALNDLRDPAARTGDVVALAALAASAST